MYWYNWHWGSYSYWSLLFKRQGFLGDYVTLTSWKLSVMIGFQFISVFLIVVPGVYKHSTYFILSVIKSCPGFHSSSDESSWRTASELLVEIAGHGEDTGFEVPCLIVAAKDDLDSFPTAIQETTRVFFFLWLIFFQWSSCT